jgi:hypothetical protein
MRHHAVFLLFSRALVACGGSAATPAAAPAAPQDVSFTITGTASHGIPGRHRHEVAVVMPDWSDHAEVERVLTMLARAFLADLGDDAVIVVAWDDPALVNVAPFNVGRAQLSRDGLGWDGDGFSLHGQGPDDGAIRLELVTQRSGPHVQGVEVRHVFPSNTAARFGCCGDATIEATRASRNHCHPGRGCENLWGYDAWPQAASDDASSTAMAVRVQPHDGQAGVS